MPYYVHMSICTATSGYGSKSVRLGKDSIKVRVQSACLPILYHCMHMRMYTVVLGTLQQLTGLGINYKDHTYSGMYLLTPPTG